MDKTRHNYTIRGTLVGKTNTTELDISKNIVHVAIKYDYEVNTYPLFVLKLQLDKTQYDTVKDNDVSVVLNIDYYEINSSDLNDEGVVTEPVILGNVLNTSLTIFDKNLVEVNRKSEDTSTDDNVTDGQLTTIILQGIPTELLDINNIVYNTVYADASVDEIIVDILSNVPKKIYYEPAVNKTRLDRILIPPLNTISSLRFIEENYGVYKSNMMLFFDTDAVYIRPIYASPLSYYTNKVDIEVSYVNDSVDVDYDTVESDGTDIKKYISSLKSRISKKDISENLIGNKIVIGSYSTTGFNLIERSYNHGDENNEKKRYYWNPSGNVLFENATLEVLTESISLILNDINPNLINPSSSITVRNNGILENYVLGAKNVIFTTKDLINYTSTCTISLGK